MKSKWPTIQENLFRIKMWCRSGMLEKDIASNLGVSVSTFEKYKVDHPELREALKNGKEIVDFQVEDSLFKKCTGHYAKETRAFKCKEIYYDEEGRRCERENVKTVEVDVFIPPDTTAIAIWLNNRKPKSWRRNSNKERLDEERFKHDQDIDGKKYF